MTSRNLERGPRRTALPAFTLIELLVVVAIIAVLIAILLPSLHGARRQSKQVLCLTNLQSQGRAAFYYAEEHKEWIGRGIMGYPADVEYGNFTTTMLRGLAYDGKVNDLWSPNSQPLLLPILERIPQFQCPEHPDPLSKLDYVASAFPIPTTTANISNDGAANTPAGDQYRGEFPPDYVGTFRLSQLPSGTNPSRFIYVTEGHVSLLTNNIRFHHFFYTSQLPLGHFPRIASDLRHSGGLNALFFDGHAVTMRHSSMDVGWPNRIALRLRWFTLIPRNAQ